MKFIRQLLRLLAIYRVIVRYGLDELLLSTKIFRPLRLFAYFAPGHWIRSKELTRGMRIRLALEELGPIFIKFGQILSVRRDLLPDDIALELAKLQDAVAPFHGDEARKIIEKAYARSMEEVFAEFDNTPLAAASIAQVHVARLHNGREVVIKVLRPCVQAQIRKDIELLYLFAGIANRYWADGRRLRPKEVVAEFEKTLYDEVDLIKEAANATQLKRNFKDSELLYVPDVEWDYTLPNLLVMERIGGISISEITTLKRLGVDLKYLANAGVEIFFTQVFRDNFFHADMHPGNIFIDIKSSHRPHYIAVDFGIMGTLSTEDQHYLAANFIAFFRRDYRRVAELHVHSGWVPQGTRVEEFEGAIRSVCEPIFDKPLKEISFGMVLLRLFQTARRFNMEVQPQLVLLQKTLLNIEGLGRQMYPELDLWKTAKPFLERWMDERVGLRAFLKGIRTNLPLWAENFPEIPRLIHESLVQREEDSANIKRLTYEITDLRKGMQQWHERIILIIVGCTLVVSSAIIMSLKTWSFFNIDMLMLGFLLGGIGSLMLLFAWGKR
ncbi:ubiquinone biosynthesis regulatory protein kinase UbiB [Candidatus Parabeggiatoa sp. HSG14]|uniref:ubiquinone biosynthesis regulatory protein kinase UbiB n=1 Tax=Candidatus Parabeggiatoa sp. HSG14 TaxID=3055593 RepID=UPI0025A82CEF|nr:ubiquinone biosynthesis regulatory protein kinase UbiB [Thiotrichales bacterium HSG14]